VSDLEELADELNRNYFADAGLPLTTPIPIEDMAEHFLGYSIDITDEGLFSDPGFLGGIDFEQKLIYVNASIENHDGRYAFTVAHEIGHHALHRDAFMQSEVEADRFAAALLMPSDSVQKALLEVFPKPKILTIGQARGLASKLIKEGPFGNVSNSAMINRLIDLKFVPEFVGYQTGRFRRGRGRPSISIMVRRALARLGI
jgi:Zn-dependent peptidase ImmA (M78 family)